LNIAIPLINFGISRQTLYNTPVIKSQTKRGELPMDNKVLQIIVCLFIPPLAVYMKKGKIDNAFWLNVVLTILGGIPGLIHGLYVILT
jgi:uncharacterized membrane protein YqaE (UPF0057 family)